MAQIHRTTMKPTKLEMLTEWLPTRRWYAGGRVPVLAKAGGFRLDDPAGEVGIEIFVVTDTSGGTVVSYLVPMTYRAAALDGADGFLIGEAQHGVLGPRFIYDAAGDRVFLEQLLALVQADVVAQDQNVSNAEDLTVACVWDGAERVVIDAISSTQDDERETRVRVTTEAAAAELTVRLVRRLTEDNAFSGSVTGQVSAGWELPDGARQHGVFFVVERGSGQS